MRRREFVRLVGGMPAAWPLIASAQQIVVAPKRVAILMGGNEDNPNYQTYLAAFRQGLAGANWREGTNLRLYVYWGNSDATRISAFATALIDLAPDLILATNTPTARALKQATGTIPIVFAGLSDPIGDGIVSSLSQPGGNITGFTSFNAPIAGKWLELRDISEHGTRRGYLQSKDIALRDILAHNGDRRSTNTHSIETNTCQRSSGHRSYNWEPLERTTHRACGAARYIHDSPQRADFFSGGPWKDTNCGAPPLVCECG
jgi:hypothetical protein